ncbi:MAG: tocopherol cyclase family protein [Firmicutes bacterium]|nr:tocopherol cyclase family protein [Bacillota bacterium]
MKYFEGFYAKLTGQKDSMAIIFGRHVYKDDKSSFIQIITQDKTYAVAYPNKFEDDLFKRKTFEVRLYKSFANEDGLFLDIDTTDLKVKGHIAFGIFSKIRYDAMGPLKFLPKMECKHYVISMKHSLEGQIVLNGKIYNFNDGIGYIEGDRGCSFPQKYFWSQCNNETQGISLFSSAARIPYLGLQFMGTICIVNYKDKEYRFASYLGAKVKHLDAKGLYVKQGKKRLEIEVLDDKKGLPLMAPINGKMNRTIYESLDRKIRYKLMVKNRIIFDFISNRSAYEYSAP